MSLLDRLERTRFGKFGIPNLMRYVIGVNIVGILISLESDVLLFVSEFGYCKYSAWTGLAYFYLCVKPIRTVWRYRHG